MTGIRASAERTGRPEGHPAARIGWVVVGLAVAVLKTEVLRWIIARGWGAGAVVMLLLMVGALWRGRPLRAAWAGGFGIALLLHSHRVWLVIALGAAGVLLLALAAVAVGALLTWWERDRPAVGAGWLG